MAALTLRAAPKPVGREFRDAVLLLKRYGTQWRILETIPRARAANGCLWLRGNQVLWYARNPWTSGPLLVERPPGGLARGRPEPPGMTFTELRELLRLWQSDLARLRQIDRTTSPIQQLRMLRAFVAPSTKPPHSPESLALAKRIYREVAQQVEAIRDGKTPQPVADLAWRAIRPGPSPAVLQAQAKLRSARPYDRVTAIQQLCLLAAPDVADAALRALSDTSPTVRLAAAGALGDFADPSCSKTLIAQYAAASKNPRDPMRMPLLRALATTDDPTAVAELILALQNPDDPLRDPIAQLLFALTGARRAKGPAPPASLTASSWLPWYEKRFGRTLQLKPWGLERLTAWITRRSGFVAPLPHSELALIPKATIDEIVRHCGNPAASHRDRWCELLFSAWEAGVFTKEQQQATLETFGRAVFEGRKVYPLGTMATLRFASGWPTNIAYPPLLRFISRSQVSVDGKPVGRPYPVPYPGIYVARLCPGDYGPGAHRLSIETEYTVRAGKGSAFTHAVRTSDQEFEVVFPDRDVGLEGKTDPALDEQVRRTFRFVVAQDAPATSTSTGVLTDGLRLRPRLARRIQPGGGSFEISGGNYWELTEKVPVDLAFDVEYEMLDFAVLLKGAPIYIPQGTTMTAEVNPFVYNYQLSGIQKPGTYRFRVHLTPSRDAALSYPSSRAYWAGSILSSPEMKFRVMEIPPAKKP
jgi:hypothetical protein